MALNSKIIVMGFAFASAFIGAAHAGKETPQELCKNQLLTYKERYQCQQALENVQTKADEKAIVRKYSDLVRAAEKAQAEK